VGRGRLAFAGAFQGFPFRENSAIQNFHRFGTEGDDPGARRRLAYLALQADGAATGSLVDFKPLEELYESD
jgi:hypothetical protein